MRLREPIKIELLCDSGLPPLATYDQSRTGSPDYAAFTEINRHRDLYLRVELGEQLSRNPSVP